MYCNDKENYWKYILHFEGFCFPGLFIIVLLSGETVTTTQGEESETSTVKIWPNHPVDVRGRETHHHHLHHCCPSASPPCWFSTSGGSSRLSLTTDWEQSGPTVGSPGEPGGERSSALWFTEGERSLCLQERKSEIGLMTVRDDGTMCVVKVRISSQIHHHHHQLLSSQLTQQMSVTQSK